MAVVGTGPRNQGRQRVSLQAACARAGQQMQSFGRCNPAWQDGPALCTSAQGCRLSQCPALGPPGVAEWVLVSVFPACAQGEPAPGTSRGLHLWEVVLGTRTVLPPRHLDRRGA